MTRRRFTVLPAFFDRLDQLLPSERADSGIPSATDFIVYDLSPILDALAEDYENETMPLPGTSERVVVTSGITARFVAITVRLGPDDRIEVVSIELDLGLD